MRQLRYNATVPLRIEFPYGWYVTALSGLTLTVLDDNGVELLAADAATLYTATTLDSAATQYTSQLVLAAGAGNPSVGDAFYVLGPNGGETVRVKGYETSTKTIETDEILENAYDAGDDVYGMFGDYSLDLTTVATYTAGKIITLLWTPAGTGTPITELAQIAKTALDIVDLEKRFSTLYPRAYHAFTAPVRKVDEMAAEAETAVTMELEAVGLDIQRLIDQSIMTPAIMAKMACLWLLNGDEDKRDEREFICKEYDKQIGILKQLPLWTDQDQDLAQDAGEVAVYDWAPERTW